MKHGFDNKKYLRQQTQAILSRVDRAGDRLYLEFGGKLLFDYHASRVLPGYEPNVKMRLLTELKDQAELIICIHAGDIEKRKIRADFGITYDADVLKIIDETREYKIDLCAVVITRFDNQPSAILFLNKLERRGVKVYTHKATKGYPFDVDTIVSDEGYGANPQIKTHKRLIVVTAPGPGSGKLGTCLSQIYHDNKNGLIAGYAKFETFPIWSLPLKHPVNIAYEAATAELNDKNLIDPFHLEAYNTVTVNYNRDIDAFPLLRKIFERITNTQDYKSPTDMGVNCVGEGIIDDEVVREASKQEVIRRWFRYSCEYAQGFTNKESVQRLEGLMNELEIRPVDRLPVIPARNAAELAEEQKRKGLDGVYVGACLILPNGKHVTGVNSFQLTAASSLIINAIKKLSDIPKHLHLLTPQVIESITDLKKDVLKGKNISLNVEETLIALSISAIGNSTTELAKKNLQLLRGCEMHNTHILNNGDDAGLRSLGINVTTNPVFSSVNLFSS